MINKCKMRKSVVMLPLVFVMMILVLIGASCTDTTEVGLGTISGVINLQSQEDHSGVSVYLYDSDLVPLELRDINQQYPQLAFPLNDKHLFDHRVYEPTKSTVTNSHGYFSFEKITYDNYIVVYLKEDWGFEYIFDVSIKSKDIYLENLSKLNQVYELPNYISSGLTMLSDRVYRVSQNTYFGPSSSLIMQEGTVLLMDSNTKLFLGGEFVVEDHTDVMIRITSSEGIYTTTYPDYGGTIEILSVANVEAISGAIVSFLYDGMILRKNDLMVNNSVFIYCHGGLYSTSSESHSFSNNMILYNHVNVPTLSLQGIDKALIKNNIFWDNTISLNIDLTTNASIHNNIFSGGESQIISVYYSNSLVEFNIFKDANVNISNSSKSNMTIKNNDVSGGICIFMGSGLYNSLTEGWTVANDNNLNGTDYAVRTRTRYYDYQEYRPLDFTQNFWGTTDTNEISNLIWDYYDEPNPSNAGVWGKIIYAPFRTSEVLDAGIQP